MSTQYYKIFLFMKRRSDISVADFRDYYENRHIPLCMKYMSGVKRYFRRYLDHQPHPETGSGEDLGYDVVTELWFDDKAVYEGTLKHLTTNIMPDEIVNDEKNFFDRSSFRTATVVECETALG